MPSGRPRTQYNARAAARFGKARGEIEMYRKNLLLNKVTGLPPVEAHDKSQHAARRDRPTHARVANFASKIKTSDQ